MKRIYGYKRRNETKHRYQGSDKPETTEPAVVINNEPLMSTFTEFDEEVELKVGAGVAKTEAPTAPQVEETEEDTGELPKHFTSFMPTDNVKPAIGETTTEEMTEPEE